MHLHHFFLLRRPVLPQQMLADFHQKVGDDTAAFHRELLRIFSDPFLKDGVFLASQSLYDALQLLLAGVEIRNAHKTYLTLYKYLIRMTSRCTPFGLFAGTVTGEIGSQTSVKISSLQQARPVCRLDTYAAEALCQYWQSRPDLREQLLFYPNSSLMRGTGHYRYLERSTSNNAVYSLTEVAYTSYLEILLQQSVNGATIAELMEALNCKGILPVEAQHFIDRIIEAQVLVSELEGRCIHSDFMDWATGKMKAMRNATPYLRDLKHLQALITKDAPLPQKAQQVATFLESSSVRVAPEQPALKVDLFFQDDRLVLDRKIVKRIVKDFAQLSVLAEGLRQNQLLEFAKAFYLRYQDQQVPLLTALDSDVGIGYGNDQTTLTQQLITGRVDTKETQAPTQPLSGLDSLRLDIYRSSLQTKQTVIEMTDQHLANLKGQPVAGNQFEGEGTYLLGSILSASASAFGRGDFKFLHLANGGPSAFHLMTRFCHGDHVLDGLVTQGLSWEELSCPEYVFAEISHLPDLGAANISADPHRRMHHINYLGSRGQVGNHHQLPVEDLYISVTDTFEVVLFSKTLKKRVMPRLTSAHNYQHGVPVYKFLGDLSHQNHGRYLNWHWGFLSDQPFLPRLQFNHIILSSACWNISKSTMEGNASAQTPLVDRWKKLAKTMDLPERFWLPRGDNQLLIDTRNIFALEIFFDYLKARETVKITEYIEDFGNGMLSHADKTFANQVIIPLLKKNKSNGLPIRPPGIAEQPEQREFLPGSQWLYLKIYCSPSSAEQILTKCLYPLMRSLHVEHAIDRWFYIRYQDSGHHLRLRVHGSGPTGSPLAVIGKLKEALAMQCYYGTVSKISIDTYHRELERYQGVSYQTVESIFYFDSVCILDVLCSGLPLEKQQLALHSLDLILDNFGFTLPEKQLFCKRRAKALLEALKADGHILNHKFKAERSWIQDALNASISTPQREMIRSFFKDRSTALSLAIAKLKNPQRRPALAASFIHMHLNRLFEADHQAWELLLYHYLMKGYSSELAQVAAKTNKKGPLDL